MKPFLLLFFIFAFFGCFAQQEEFNLQGRVVDKNMNPISDAYIVNTRNLDKNTSRSNGVFDARVLPGDSLIISHVSFFRKMVSVYQILKNPNVWLELDTINIEQIDILSDEMTDAERAAENIKSIEFDFRPMTNDEFTETERMEDLLNSENRVQRTEASALTYRFSPSEKIGKLIERIKKRKKSNEYYSTKKKKKGNKKQEPN